MADDNTPPPAPAKRPTLVAAKLRGKVPVLVRDREIAKHYGIAANTFVLLPADEADYMLANRYAFSAHGPLLPPPKDAGPFKPYGGTGAPARAPAPAPARAQAPAPEPAAEPAANAPRAQPTTTKGTKAAK